MIATAIAVLCIALSGFFKAVSDTLAHHFSRSVFRWKDPRFWNPEVSWKEAKVLRFTKYKWDAWHISNSLMIICFIVAAVIHSPLFAWYIEIPIGGVIFNIFFNVFYNKILLKKKVSA